jgi:hypothetical protein
VPERLGDLAVADPVAAHDLGEQEPVPCPPGGGADRVGVDAAAVLGDLGVGGPAAAGRRVEPLGEPVERELLPDRWLGFGVAQHPLPSEDVDRGGVLAVALAAPAGLPGGHRPPPRVLQPGGNPLLVAGGGI